MDIVTVNSNNSKIKNEYIFESNKKSSSLYSKKMKK